MMSGDDQGRLPETPDVSLGSLCQNTVGEELDDMDFDQMYDSPAVSSMSFGEGSSVGPVSSGINLRSASTRVLWPAQGLGGSPQEFDSLPLIDISEFFGDDFDEGVWLIKQPSEIPSTFNEEDRSYLDTSLLNLRFSLLNIVSADMNGTLRGTEEIAPETTYSPKEISTGSATIRINKSLNNRQRLGYQAHGANGSIAQNSYAIADGVVGMDLSSNSVNSPIRSFGGSIVDPMTNYGSEMGVINSSVYNTSSVASASHSQLRHGNEDIPGIANIEGMSPISRVLPPATRLRNVDELGSCGGSQDARNLTYLEDQTSYLDHSAKEIDSRTYTRTKKNRMSLVHSTHPLNTTIDLSPPRSNSSSPSKRLNTTISISPDRNRQGAASATNPVNLNETFDAEESERNNEVNSDRSRRVKRNQSYVIRREEEPSNNNTLPHAHASPAGGPDLNNTFTFEGDGDVDVCQISRVESHNNSMDGLNSRVESQIRSLGCNPTGVHRGRFSDQNERAIRQMEEARLVGRTLSTDTYSLAQSSDSASSDLSSPMDTQSYDDLQANEAVRRSMPNLASRAATGIRSNLGFQQTSSGQLCKKDYMVSDSRLTRLGSSDRPRLSVMTSETRNMGFSRGSVTSESSSSRATDRNTSNPSLNRTLGMSSGVSYQAPGLGSPSGRRDMTAGRPQSTMAGVRAVSGLQGPRYVGVSSGIARPPRAASGIPTARGGGVPRSGLPVPAYRSQSRLAAPGTLRSAAPSQRSALYQPRLNEPSKTKDWQDGCY